MKDKPMKANNSSIKVIAGSLKNHKLLMADSTTTRSSKAILKESLFNTLAPFIQRFGFIEVFAGTGSIGIESLSRGAKEAIFLERDKKAFDILQTNLSSIKLKCPQLQTLALLGDSFTLLPQVLEKRANDAWILFFDPPFPIRENCADIYEKCFHIIEQIQTTHPILVIFEALSSYEMPQNIQEFSIIKAKKFGKSSLVYYANKEVSDG